MNNKREIQTISGLYFISRITIITLILIISFSYLYSPIRERIHFRNMNKNLETRIANLQIEVDILEKEKLELNNEKQELVDEKNLLAQEIKNFEKEKADFQNNLINSIDHISKLKSKYNYALTYSKKFPKADFGINELVYLDNVCNEYNVPIELMLAIYEKESQFYSLAKNKTSTATGYGQLIDSTAKSVYEKMLNFGTYDINNHRTIACDKKLNILMSCRLMKYNIDSYKTHRAAVEHYYGSKDDAANKAYANSISSLMSHYGSSL